MFSILEIVFPFPLSGLEMVYKHGEVLLFFQHCVWDWRRFFLLFCRIVLLVWITPNKRTWDLKITKAPNLNGKSSSKTSFFGSQLSGGLEIFGMEIKQHQISCLTFDQTVPNQPICKRTISPIKVSCSRVEIFPSQEDLSGKTSGPRPGNLLKID